MNPIGDMFQTDFNKRGFAPNPTSFFFLIKRTKQEKSRQNDPPPALLQGKNFRQSGQASLPKFYALQHSHPKWPPRFVWPPHGALNEANAVFFVAEKQSATVLKASTIADN